MRICSVCGRCFSDEERNCADPDHQEFTDAAGRDVEMVSGYQIVRLLEKDSPIERYLAKQTDTNTECVVSVVPLQVPDQKPFLDEARTAASLIHPSIADVYTSGVLETGEVYYIAEAPRSRTLRDFLNENSDPPLLITIQIIRETAEAVHVLHTSGLTHGAIRPENILVRSSQNNIKLQNPDFGAAARRSIIANKLTIDSAIDAIRYFAPEQLSAEKCGPQSDVYALGVLLFEMLSGSTPFEGSTAAELIECIRGEHPPEVKIDNFDLRMLLTHTLMESLQKQPAFRQPTALAFARQIRHIEQLATHTATPPAPFPGAIPQKQSAAAGAGQTRPKRSSASGNKLVDAVPALQPIAYPVKQVPEPESAALPAASDEMRKAPDSSQTSQPLAGDLNQIRLRSWKEKYHAATSVFRSDSKRGIQQLSLSDAAPQSEPPQAARAIEMDAAEAVSAAPPTRIKIEWEQPDDDLPSVEQIRKLHVEESFTEVSPVKAGTEDVEEVAAARTVTAKHRSETPLFASFEKPPRWNRAVQTVQHTGLFSSLGTSVSAASMNRRIIAGSFAVAVIIGLFFGSSLLERKQVRSASSEVSESKTVPPAAVEPARHALQERDTEIGKTENEASVPVAPIQGSEELTDSVRSKQPISKVTVSDAVIESKPRSRAVAPAQAVSKPASATNAAKPAMTPSTLVISPGNGKVKTKVEAGNGSAFTRPRIVANPKP